jgi:hypothetical protein
MIFSIGIAALAVGFALLRGGSLERLLATSFRFPALLFTGLIVQVVFEYWNPPFMTGGWNIALFAFTQTLVVIFLLVNWRLPGMWLAALGLILNVVVISANGGMPIKVDESRRGEFAESGEIDLDHELITTDTVLPFLGDVIPLPFTIRVISIGDVVLALGIGRFAYRRSLEDPVEESTPVQEST